MHNNKINATINAVSLSTWCSFKYLPLDMPSSLQGLFLESLLPSCGPTNESDHLGRSTLQKPVHRGEDTFAAIVNLTTDLQIHPTSASGWMHGPDCPAQGGNCKLILHLCDGHSLCYCIQQTPAAATRALPAASWDRAQAETHGKRETSLFTQSTQVRRYEYASQAAFLVHPGHFQDIKHLL